MFCIYYQLGVLINSLYMPAASKLFEIDSQLVTIQASKKTEE